MKTRMTPVTALLITLLAAGGAQAETWTGHSSLMLGSKQIREHDWAKDDEHGAIALLTDFRQENWPVSIAVDLVGTGSEEKIAGNKHETYTAEIHVGVRKVFDFEDCRIHPYFGGGLALINGEQKDRVSGINRSDEDSTTGGWIGVGAYVDVTPSFTLGLDVRHSRGEVTLFDRDVDTSGTLAGITAGYHW